MQSKEKLYLTAKRLGYSLKKHTIKETSKFRHKKEALTIQGVFSSNFSVSFIENKKEGTQVKVIEHAT